MDGLRSLRCLISSKSSEPSFFRHPFINLVKFRRHFGSVASFGSSDLSSPSVPNTGAPVAILWDLDNKPPNSYPPFDAATRLKKAASSFGFVHYMVAFANHHAFKHVPPFVREQRKERKTLNQLENKGIVRPAHPYLCRVCGRKFFANDKLVTHFKQIHEREHTKRLNQLESAKGKRRVQLAAKFSMKMDKYKSAARDVLTPKVGYGLADELKRAGFWVNLVSDKPQAADTALRNHMVELMDKRQVECFVIVSDDCDFITVLKEARLRCLKTVVVGDDPDGALKRCADASFSWKEIMLGKAKKEAVSVLGRWKDRDVLKRLEWTYRPELEQSKHDISDSEAENEDEEVGDIISEGGPNFINKVDTRPWWELDSDLDVAPAKSSK